jgi:hypothetical protein
MATKWGSALMPDSSSTAVVTAGVAVVVELNDKSFGTERGQGDEQGLWIRWSCL